MVSKPTTSESHSSPKSTHATSHPLQVYFHTHWDREWYLPFRQYQTRLMRVMPPLLNAVETGKIPCFALDGQTILLDDYLELKPKEERRLRKLVADKRLSIGPWYVMPDEFLVSGESLIRNLEKGIKQSRAYGQKTFTGYIPDTFGHSADMPLIFTHCGIHSAMLWRGVNPDSTWFWWESIGGQRLLTYHLTVGYFQNVFHMGHTEQEKTTWFTDWRSAVEAKTLPGLPMLYPIGADHLGFDEQTIADMAHAAADYTVTTPDQFMAEPPLHDSSLPKIMGELADCSEQYILPGVYASRMYLKQANRHLEWQLTHRLEPLLSWLSMSDHPSDMLPVLDLAWTLLLQNHPHDSICGCSVDAVHQENEVRFLQVQQLCDDALRLSHEALLTSTGFESGFGIFNLSQQPYTGVVEVQGHYPTHPTSNAPIVYDPVPQPLANCQVVHEETGLDETYLLNTSVLPLSEHVALNRTSLIFVSDLDAQSLSHVCEPAVPPHAATVSEGMLDNGLIQVLWNSQGEVIFKDCQRDITYAKAMRFVRWPEQGDSYNAAPVPGTPHEWATFVGARFVHEGPLRASVLLTHRFEQIGMTLETTLSLDAASTRVAMQTRFLNQTADHKIQVRFSAAQPIETVCAQGHFMPVLRSVDPDYRIEDHMPAPRLKELKTNTGSIQQFIQVQDQTFYTKGLVEYEVFGSDLGLTFHRGFSMLSSNETQVRGSHAGPPLPTPGGQCLGREFVVEYAWQPNLTYTEALHQAHLYYGACYGMERLSNTHAKAKHSSVSYLQVSHPDVWVSAMIPEEEGWRVRLVNPTPTALSFKIFCPPWLLHANKGALKVTVVNAIGDKLHSHIHEMPDTVDSTGRMAMQLGAYNMVTLRFSR